MTQNNNEGSLRAYEDEIVTYDAETKRMDISLEGIISNMLISKEQKEELYLAAAGVTPDQGRAIWKDDKIEGLQLFQPMEKLSMVIKIDKEGQDE